MPEMSRPSTSIPEPNPVLRYPNVGAVFRSQSRLV
jgi:hypothetical protein